MKKISKVFPAILSLSLISIGPSVISPQTSFAANPVSKSISGATAEKMLKAAYAKNSEHNSKSPYTISLITYYKDKTTKTDIYSADALGNMYNKAQYGAETILIGQDYYSTEHDELNPQELAIATELGLNTEAKFAQIKITEIEPIQTLKEWQETIRFSAIINFSSRFPLAGMMKLYPKSKLTLKTESNKKTITFSNPQLGSRDVWTITNGLVTSYIIYDANNKMEYKAIFKTTSPLIAQPEGPFMEVGKLIADPRYKALQG